MSQTSGQPTPAHRRLVIEIRDRNPSTTAWAILAAMALAGFSSALLYSAGIAPALPAIRTDLRLDLSAQAWLITSHLLAFGVALIAGGRLGDILGEVKVIVIGFAIFMAGLVGSATAVSGLLMIVGRTIQGAGVGICAPATLSIVINTFPLAKRGLAVGIWGFAHGLGMFAGPLFTASMMAISNWRWTFWGAAVLPMLTIVSTLRATRTYRSPTAGGRYDWTGVILGGMGIALVIYALQTPLTTWNWGFLTLGAGLLGVFCLVEAKSTSPLVDLNLFREHLFAGGCLAYGAVGMIFMPFLTVVGALAFIDILGYSPAKAGWVITISTATCMALQPVAGRWVDRIGPGIPITTALAMQAAALACSGLMFGPSTTLAQMVIPLALMGAGAGIALPACNTAAMSAVDPQRAGMGSGVMQMSFSVFASLGVALVTAVCGTRGGARFAVGLDVRTELYAASSAITMSMLVLAAIAAGGAVSAWAIIGRRSALNSYSRSHHDN